MLQNAGFEGTNYGLHSPRTGGASDAFAAKVPDHVIDWHGRWRTASTKYRYLRVRTREQIAEMRAAINYE